MIYLSVLLLVQGRSVNDFLRHLKATYVEALDAQQDGEIDPLAFNWARLSKQVADSHHIGAVSFDVVYQISLPIQIPT